FGTSQDDFSLSTSVDQAGNPYAVGETSGNLSGVSGGGSDAFLIKLSLGGNNVWTKQIGSSGRERAQSVFADKHGSIYFTGVTDGVVGQVNAGGADVVVAKYESSGSLDWIRQFGTNLNQEGRGITADTNGNVYVVGNTEGSLGG